MASQDPICMETASTIQLSNLYLNLKSSVRDSLISILVKFSSVLSGKAISSEAKDQMLADNACLIEQLSNLQLRLDQYDERPKKRVKHEEESTDQPELIFAIDWNTKSRIICLLIANKNFAFPKKCDSGTLRNNVMKQNDLMIHTLLNLRSDSMEMPATITNGRCSDEETESETETFGVASQMMKKVDDRIFALEIQLKNEINSLKDEMAKSIQQVRTELDTGRSEIEFNWELKEFSKLSTSKVYRSSWFYVRSVPWYLFTRVSEIDGKDGGRFLDLFLCIQNNIGCNKWKCKVEYEMRILNQSAGKENIVIQNEHTFAQNEGFGSEKVVRLDHLKKNGFVKEDDTLRLQVKLKAGEIVKN